MIKFDGKSNRLKVRRQDVATDGVTVSMRVNGAGHLVGQMRAADGAVSAVKSRHRLKQHEFRNVRVVVDEGGVVRVSMGRKPVK